MKLDNREVLPIGLGTWHMGDQLAKRNQEIAALRTGIEQGAQVIDTAEMYGKGNAERLVGEAIQPYQREELYLISKVYPWNASTKQLPISLENSLKRLQTDYLDMYLLHWTGNIPLKETVAAMEQARKAGLIRSWGVSNFDVSDMEELLDLPDGRYCQSNQVLYNLGERGIEFDLLPYMREKHIPLIAYSPIAQGDSLGDGLTQQKLLQEIATAHQASVFQILLAWCIRDGHTLAIPQSSDQEHTISNIKAAEIQLTKEEITLIDKIYPTPTHKQRLAVL
ncbi:aldo/keto reductase [Enterococcus olivae]